MKKKRMRKEHIATYFFMFVLVGVSLGGLYFLNVSMTGFAVYEQSNQSGFDQGTYSNTEYNASAVALVGENLTGTYISKIFDATGNAQWNNISWTGTEFGELLDNKQGSLMNGNVLLLHMNNDWLDTSGEGNNGTASGAIFSTSSKLGSHAGSFDGSNDKVNYGNDASLNLRTTLTISAWINLDTITPAHGLHSTIIGDTANSNWWFYIGNNAKLGFLRFKAGTPAPGYDAVGSNADISVGSWTYVAVTYDSSIANEVNLYINGQLDKTGNLDGPIDALGTALWVGDRGSAHRLDGKIDELSIWNRTLSSNEISEIYKRGILRLNLTARTCDDNVCSGESFTDIVDESPQDLSLTNNQYFQYKFAFETDDSSYSPELQSVGVDYTILNSAPTITLASPQEGATYGYNESLALNFIASDSDNNLDSCWYNIDGGNDVTIDNCANTSFDVSGDGTYNLTIYANDTQGEQASDSATFNVEVGAPTIILSSPTDVYLNYQEDIQFAYTPTDIDLDSCELWGDFTGEFTLNQTNTNPTSGSENTFNLSLNDGTYLWNIKCNDSQGNSAFNGNKTFDVDTVAPNVSLTEPIGTKTSRTVSLVWNVSDLNLDSCWFNVYRGENIELANTSVNCSLNSTTFDVTVDANFVLNFYVNDSAGNSVSTSSSFSVDTSSGDVVVVSSGGGGSSRTTVIQTQNGTIELTVGEIQDLIVELKDVKQVSWLVKNTGTNFLNGCKIKGEESYASWVFSDEIKNLASGEEYGFVFDIVVPENVESGKYPLIISLNCAEVSEFSGFVVEILEKKLSFDLVEVSRIGDNEIKVIYFVEELSGLEQEVEIQFLLFDFNNEKVAEVKEIRKVLANSTQEFEIVMPVDSSLEGELSLLVNLNSETYSTFVQENIILGSSISGFAVFGEGEEGFDNILSLLFILLFFVFAFFIVRRIWKQRKKK